MKAVQNIKTCVVRTPIDTNGTPQGGNYQFLSFKNAAHAVVNYLFGNVAGDCAITLKQAKNVGGGSNKALAFTKIYACKTNSGSQEDMDRFNEETVSANSYTVAAATHDNYHFKIELRSDALDRDNGFDCIRPELADPAAACLVAIWVDFYHTRYNGDQSDPNIFPSHFVN